MNHHTLLKCYRFVILYAIFSQPVGIVLALAYMCIVFWTWFQCVSRYAWQSASCEKNSRGGREGSRGLASPRSKGNEVWGVVYTSTPPVKRGSDILVVFLNMINITASKGLCHSWGWWVRGAVEVAGGSTPPSTHTLMQGRRNVCLVRFELCQRVDSTD